MSKIYKKNDLKQEYIQWTQSKFSNNSLYLVAIEVMKEVTQKKKKSDIDKSWDRSRKIQEFVIISKDENEDSNFLEYKNIEIK